MSQNAALPAAVRQADARGTAVDVVALIDRFDVPGQRVNAAPALLRLREQRIIGEPLILQQRLQRAGAAAEAERVDRRGIRPSARRSTSCRRSP